jgi:hypothetical protein
MPAHVLDGLRGALACMVVRPRRLKHTLQTAPSLQLRRALSRKASWHKSDTT